MSFNRHLPAKHHEASHRPTAFLCLKRRVMRLCLLLLLINPVHAESTSIPEVRALYLYNFAMFIRWPDKAFPTRNSPIRYCVLGGRALRRTLARLLENEKVKGHPLVLEPPETPIDASHCHLLYVDDTLTDDEDQLITALENQPVLTVGASRSFPHNGGMIALVRKGRRIRPLVNMKAVEQSGIRISSKLLQLSTLLSDDEVVKSP